MAIPGESFTSSLRTHLIKNAIKPEWLLFGVSSEQLGDAVFKLGSCKALGVGGRRLQRRGFPELGTKLRARYPKENQDQHFRRHGSTALTALARSIRGRRFLLVRFSPRAVEPPKRTCQGFPSATGAQP